MSATESDDLKLYGDLEEQGFNNEIVEGPVEDWATDFDHLDEVWAADPYPILDDLRERCPIAHTDRYGGAWLPTTHEDVAAVAYDTDRFSSRMVVMGNHRPPFETAPQGVSPPISSDPPFHHDARRLLLPAFAPKAIERLEPATREFCHSLLSSLEGKDVVDAAVEYAQHIPVRVIAHMLGFPQEDADRFREFVHNVLEGINTPDGGADRPHPGTVRVPRPAGGRPRRQPRDDLTSFLLDAKMGDQALDEEHVTGTMALLLIAGIDTTWSAIGASIWHLADHPADRQRLVDDPDLLPVAMEELLRAYAPRHHGPLGQGRHGVERLPDEAGRLGPPVVPVGQPRPAAFEQAGEVVIDREVNRHAAFGLGIHRCVGSHLARMEGGAGGVARALPRVLAGRPVRGHLVGRSGARAAHAPRHHRFLTGATLHPVPPRSSRAGRSPACPRSSCRTPRTARSTGRPSRPTWPARSRPGSSPRSTWTPATCSCSPDDRRRVLDLAAEVSGGAFVAGAFVADGPGAAFDLAAHVVAADDISSRGGTPVLFPSHGLNEQDEKGWVGALAALGAEVDRFIGFELGPMFVPYGRIVSLDAYRGMVEIPQCVGAKHSSLSRCAEWERLALRDEVRPGFQVLTGNDLAIDMVMYGSDYLLGLSTFARAFAAA